MRERELDGRAAHRSWTLPVNSCAWRMTARGIEVNRVHPPVSLNPQT
jgi:hypothetical protein